MFHFDIYRINPALPQQSAEWVGNRVTSSPRHAVREYIQYAQPRDAVTLIVVPDALTLKREDVPPTPWVCTVEPPVVTPYTIAGGEI